MIKAWDGLDMLRCAAFMFCSSSYLSTASLDSCQLSSIGFLSSRYREKLEYALLHTSQYVKVDLDAYFLFIHAELASVLVYMPILPFLNDQR